MTTAMYRHIERQIDKAGFDQTSDLARRIEDGPNLTKAERIMLGDKLVARLRTIVLDAIVREAATP